MTGPASVLSVCMLVLLETSVPVSEQVLLKSGTEYMADVVSSSDQEMTIRFVQAGTPVTLTLRRDQIAAPSWYRVRAIAIGDDARGRVELARFGAENGLFFQAERDLNRAVKLDPSLSAEVDVEIARVRDGAALLLIALAREALERGDVTKAESLVSTTLTRYGGTAQADAARELVDRVAARKLELEEQREAERAAKLVAQEAARQVALLDGARKKIETARKRNIEGLKHSSLSQAQGSFVASIRSYDQALREVDRILAQDNGDQLRSRVDEVRSVVIQEAIEVHVSLGSTYLVRGSFTTALTHANEALALDTRNQYAKEFRARVEIASAEASRGRFTGRRSAR